MTWEDKAIKRLTNANKNVEDMKGDMLAWATNTQKEKANQTFIQRQGFFLGFGTFMLACAAGLYALGFFLFWFFLVPGLFIFYRVIAYELRRKKIV